jgi:hypothetical protein
MNGKHIANAGGCREPVAETALRQKRWEQKTKCQSGNLSRTSSSEMKKHNPLRENQE